MNDQDVTVPKEVVLAEDFAKSIKNYVNRIFEAKFAILEEKLDAVLNKKDDELKVQFLDAKQYVDDRIKQIADAMESSVSSSPPLETIKNDVPATAAPGTNILIDIQRRSRQREIYINKLEKEQPQAREDIYFDFSQEEKRIIEQMERRRRENL